MEQIMDYEMTQLDMAEISAYQNMLIDVLRDKFKRIPYELTKHIQGIMDKEALRDLAFRVPSIQSLDELILPEPQKAAHEKSLAQRRLEEQEIAIRCEILIEQMRAKFEAVPEAFIERVRTIESENSLRHLSIQILFVSSYDDLILPKTKPAKPDSSPQEIETEPTAHSIVLKLLNAKFGPISDELTQRIRAINDEVVLTELVTHILYVKSLGKLTLPK